MKIRGHRFILIGMGLLSLWALTLAQKDLDRALKKPTLSQTTRRFGIVGTDLGSSFEHKGNLYFLFGDTLGQPGALDAIGWTRSRDPEKIALDFHSGRGGRWLPPSVPGIKQAGLEIPSGGISIGGTMFGPQGG